MDSGDQIMTFIVSTTDSPYEVWSGPDPLGVLVTSNRMARTDAQRMAGVDDVNRTLRIATVDVAFGRIAPLHRPPREGPETRPRVHALMSSAASSAFASAISGISDVGAKPSRAGARMPWASTGRAVDW